MGADVFGAGDKVCGVAAVSNSCDRCLLATRVGDRGIYSDLEVLLTPNSVSVGVIYLVVVRTHWLSNDPMLWFTMMLMPTGPPALKLTALADVNGNSDQDKMAIAKFLTVSHSRDSKRVYDWR